MGRRWTLRSPHTASSRLVRAPTARPGSLSLCGSPAGSASPCCPENPAAAKEGTLLTTGDQVAKSPCGCIKAAGKWGPNTRLQGLSLGDKTCNICLCAHPTAPGPAITQLRMASGGRAVPGHNKSPWSSGTETALHPNPTAPNTHHHRLLIFYPLWTDFCTVLSINQFPVYLLQSFQEFMSFQQWHHSREM